MKKQNVIFVLIVYFILLFIDIGLNGLAVFIPSIGGVVESFSEIVLEGLSAVLVIILAFAKD